MSRGALSSLGHENEEDDEDEPSETPMSQSNKRITTKDNQTNGTDTITCKDGVVVLLHQSKAGDEARTINHLTEGSPQGLNLTQIGNQPSIFNQNRRVQGDDTIQITN
jgi:hypothetical protein